MKRSTLNHPKLRPFCNATGTSRIEALGILTLLWDFTGEYAPQGNVGKFTNESIAEKCDWPAEDADRLINALVDAGWLDADDDGHRLIVHDWEEHCEQWVKKRVYRCGLQFVHPKRPDEMDIQNVHPKRPDEMDGPPSLAMPSHAMPDCDASASLAQPPKRGPSVRVPRSVVVAVYDAYPRKVGRAKALLAIERAIRGGVDPDHLLERVRAFAESPAGRAGKFTPHPATWFNAGRWDDDPAEWQHAPGDNGTATAAERRAEANRRVIDEAFGDDDEQQEPQEPARREE